MYEMGSRTFGSLWGTRPGGLTRPLPSGLALRVSELRTEFGAPPQPPRGFVVELYPAARGAPTVGLETRCEPVSHLPGFFGNDGIPVDCVNRYPATTGNKMP